MESAQIANLQKITKIFLTNKEIAQYGVKK